MSTPAEKRVVEQLAKSELFRGYERAFGEATGLPLNLTTPDNLQLAHHGRRHENAFCAMLAKSNRSCAACLSAQHELANGASNGPRTTTCFAGLLESCVPVRQGGKLIAYLRTGEIAARQPTRRGFARIARQLRKWDPKIDVQELQRAYLATPVLSSQHYQSMLKLLTVFAEHLALVANVVVLHHENAEPPNITRSRQFIEEHMGEDLSLGDAARAANMSTFYFCKQFKKGTGLNFIEYLSRVRVEAAQKLLLNQNARVSEVAFEVGFQSITHFNRVFKVLLGQSPTEYRAALPHAA
ncbi:MAG: helix-turn-helix domain-containing protein [Chthoniobacteraceae bacterium]